MSGITGWVDFERDLHRDGATVRAMTATLAGRGPDAEELWLSSRAILGHRRLAVVDREGGRQPKVAEEDGKLLAVVVFNGEIYNADELRGQLVSHGHRFRTRSDTEVVLRAYLQWGAEAPRRFNGMFAFGIWDVRKEELLLARDHIGAKPLIYYPTPTGVLFGSEPKAILAHPSVPAVVDFDGLREVLSQSGTPGEVAFRGMKEVRAGHLVRIRRQGLTVEKFWGAWRRTSTPTTSKPPLARFASCWRNRPRCT
ncbi:asparagine synthetase B family protein [Fodinicola feengrottensis]|uniref:asparagine synthetase B family protein n=1 Tax=Fodinicola feengrottensis TaxID=435914 RepID=UPI0024428608|nr:hypothetical protein [Fodinicola feengrottensis]